MTSVLRLPTISCRQIEYFRYNFHALQNFYAGRHGRMLRYKLISDVKTFLNEGGMTKMGRIGSILPLWRAVGRFFWHF